MRCKVFHSNLETQLEKQFQSLSHDHHYMFVSLSLNFMEPFPRGSNHQTIFYLIEIHSFRFLIDMQTILDEKKLSKFFIQFFGSSLNSILFKWQKIRVDNFLKNRLDTIFLFLKTSVGTNYILIFESRMCTIFLILKLTLTEINLMSQNFQKSKNMEKRNSLEIWEVY